jgi:hypothetical protein
MFCRKLDAIKAAAASQNFPRPNQCSRPPEFRALQVFDTQHTVGGILSFELNGRSYPINLPTFFLLKEWDCSGVFRRQNKIEALCCPRHQTRTRLIQEICNNADRNGKPHIN